MSLEKKPVIWLKWGIFALVEFNGIIISILKQS